MGWRDVLTEVILANTLKTLVLGAAAAGLAVLAAWPAAAEQMGGSSAAASCFFVTQWQGWRAASPDVIYIRVGVNDIYRLELSTPSASVLQANMHLVNEVRGSNSICSPVDFDLQISDQHGFREPLIVKSMTKLSPQEAAALPAKFKP